MARRIGVMGLPNTGKSFSRTYIQNSEDCFVITPSDKDPYLRKDGKPVEELKILINGKCYKEVAKDNKQTPEVLIKGIVNKATPPEWKIEITGNYAFVADLNFIGVYIGFIAEIMPNIKNLFIADFTHIISEVVTSSKFMKRSSGGEAFARYTDLAADSLNNVFKSIGGLRGDLLVFTEFHTQMGDEGFYKIFLPAGKMLSDKFLPESYFDIMLCTTVLPYSETIDDEAERYKFIVNKQEPYDARSANLFGDLANKGMIPNNMDIVLERIRKYYNI